MRWYDSLWLQKVGLATPWSSVLAETFMSQRMKLCQCFHIKPVFSWTFIYGESLHVRSCLRIPFSFLLKFYKPVTWLGWDLHGSEIKGGPHWGSRESGVTFSSSMLLSPIKKKHVLLDELLDMNGKSCVCRSWVSWQWSDLVWSKCQNPLSSRCPRSLPWLFCMQVCVQVLPVLLGLRAVIHKL